MNPPPIVAGSHAWPASGPPTVVTIGNFDGVHLGHRELLGRTVSLARERGARACAFTFDPAPRDVLRPDNPIPRIQRLVDRVDLLLGCGMDHVIVEPFSRDYAAHDAEWFATVVLAGRLRASAVVVGWDFRFGKGRGGTVDTLRSHLSVPVEQVPALTIEGEIVSSSRIRQAIAGGQVGQAASLLARPHSVVGTVVPGSSRGRELGFPTANVNPSTPLLPAPGVYAVQTSLDGQVRGGVANFGSRPTFGGGPATLEVHLFDFDGDLYGREIAIELIERLRDERRFDSRDALVAQIARDAQAARAALQAR